jgi:phage antirepressor YoqD-like protein/phage anti-repressor protein
MSNHQSSFSLALAQEYISSVEDFPVDFEDAWQWLDYSRKDNAKRAFEKSQFVENIDYQVFLTSAENPLGGRPSHSIKLSVECFKTWAMLSQTEKGKQVRLYFLECEKIAKKQVQLPQNYLEALKALVASEEEKQQLAAQKQQLEKTIEQNAPLVEYAQKIQFSEDSIELGEYARLIKTGRNRLTFKMRELNILMQKSAIPYQRFFDAGYFELSQEIVEYTNKNGEPATRIIPFALITGKGQLWLYNKLQHLESIEKRAIAGISDGVVQLSCFVSK